MCVYLRTKFQVSRVIQTSFRERINFSPIPKQTPKKPTLIRVKTKIDLLPRLQYVLQ